MTKSTEECTAEIRVAMVKRGEYPVSALPGEWDEWFMVWDGDEN